MVSTGGSGPSSARGRWDLGAGDAESILAEARKAFFAMVAVLVVLWIVQIVNWADHYQLTLDYGIRPRDISSLPNIFTAPFLHFSWAHIEGNSGPLFIFGFLAAYRGVKKFIFVTILVVLTSGLTAWIAQAANTVGAGASGVVFGYFGYIMVRGFFDRHPIDMIIGAIMALCFAYQFTVLLHRAGIGWPAHIRGAGGRGGRAELPRHAAGHDPKARRSWRLRSVSTLLTNIGELVTNDGGGAAGP